MRARFTVTTAKNTSTRNRVMTDGRQFPASTDTTASKMLRIGGCEYYSLRKAGS